MGFQREFPKKSSSQSALIPAQNPLQSRPFAAPLQPEQSLQEPQPQTTGLSSNLLDKISIQPRDTSPPPVQMKLTLGEPGDKYEQEADRVARQVVQRFPVPTLQLTDQGLQEEAGELKKREKREAAWRKDGEALMERIQKLKNSEKLQTLCKRFVEELEPSEPKLEKKQPDDDTSSASSSSPSSMSSSSSGPNIVYQIIDCIESMNGLEVPYDWYLENQGQDNFELLRKQSAQEFTKHGRLWSKLNVRKSEKAAKATGGIALETTVGGYIFNGLNFGYSWGESPAISLLWQQLSPTYVKHLHGTIEADVLEGIDPSSVLSKIEIKEVLKLIEENKVEKLTVNIHKMTNNQFKLVDKIDVKGKRNWESLPKVPTGKDAKKIGSGTPGKIDDIPWKERQSMIDKTEKLLRELEAKLKTVENQVENGEALVTVSQLPDQL
ncbi:MAG TPA: hypothetical protein V6C85_12355 [Allocoleopsis sp.]